MGSWFRALVQDSGLGSSPVPAGADKEIQFNDGGVGLGGNAELIYDKATGELTFLSVKVGSNWNLSAESGFASGGTTGKIKVDLGSGALNTLEISNKEPGGGGTLILDQTPQGLKLQSNIEIDITSDTAAPIAIAIGNGTDLLAFFGAGGVVKPTVVGAKGGNAALASLLTQLAALGLITDSST